MISENENLQYILLPDIYEKKYDDEEEELCEEKVIEKSKKYSTE